MKIHASIAEKFYGMRYSAEIGEKNEQSQSKG